MSANGPTHNGAVSSVNMGNKMSLASRNGAVNQVSGTKVDALSKQPSSRRLHSPLENLAWDNNVKVLPSDESFSWSKENYSNLQRTIDVWSFVFSLRARIYFDGAKWSFIGGFSEEKQVIAAKRYLFSVFKTKQG